MVPLFCIFVCLLNKSLSSAQLTGNNSVSAADAINSVETCCRTCCKNDNTCNDECNYIKDDCDDWCHLTEFEERDPEGKTTEQSSTEISTTESTTDSSTATITSSTAAVEIDSTTAIPTSEVKTTSTSQSVSETTPEETEPIWTIDSSKFANFENFDCKVYDKKSEKTLLLKCEECPWISQDGQTKNETCYATKIVTYDIGVNESWAWGHFFIHMIIAMLFAAMFAYNITPAITPPYNKVVLGILVLTLINMIIACCGMSHNLNESGPEAISGAAVSFSLFTLLATSYIGYGSYIECGAPQLRLG